MPEYKESPYTFNKQGTYYFVRRVPKDLFAHYLTRKISYSLRTKNVRVARSRALLAAAHLDEQWFYLRSQQTSVIPQFFVQQRVGLSVPSAQSLQNPSLSVSKAISIYTKLKGQGKSKTSLRAVERSMEYLVSACGKKSLTDYTKADAVAFRDALMAKGLTGSSIARVFGTVRSVCNLAFSEMGFDITNPFAGVYFDRQAGVIERQPIPTDDIRRVQKACHKTDDDIRWLVALISDTGMRLSEAVGLPINDIVLNEGDIPFVRVREHPWRRLKTKDSVRDIPLVGASLWACQRIARNAQENQFAFPRYNTNGLTNANSASAALNKWLKGYVPEGCSLHGFRHAMRDRLRAVQCPAEIIDQIGGWSGRSIGEGYGKGFEIEVLYQWLGRIKGE